MEDLFVNIYLLVTFPLWFLLTVILIILKIIWFGLLWILKLIVSFFTFNKFDIYSFFYDFLGPVVNDYDSIVMWFKNTYYKNSFLALILFIFCIFVFWFQGYKRK